MSVRQGRKRKFFILYSNFFILIFSSSFSDFFPSPAFFFLFYLHIDLLYVKMVQHVPILMEVTPVFVSMDGQATIAVKISMIVLMLRALMERHVLMALEILHVDVHPERLVFYVI